jgi:hypothetical protein
VIADRVALQADLLDADHCGRVGDGVPVTDVRRARPAASVRPRRTARAPPARARAL